MKKTVLIVFSDGHLPYSPTVINLYDILSENFDVKIVAFKPISYMAQHKSEERNINYIPLSLDMRLFGNKLIYIFLRISTKLGFFKSLKCLNDYQRLKAFKRAFLLWNKIRKLEVDTVIGVDFLSLWVIQIAFGKGHLLSLEIDQDDPFYQIVDKSKIQSVVIQTEERYQYLFPNLNLTKFFVQNAPIYRPLISVPSERIGLVFCGTAVPEFGIYHCLDFLAEYPEFTLTIRGGIREEVSNKIQTDYEYLIKEKRLILNNSYIERDKLSEYLSQFHIGFCFYILEGLKEYYDIFNYLTVPSGKLFNYYAAGVPVVGSNIPGLSSVTDFETGVLINNYSPLSIRQAIETINSNHSFLSANCLKAAEHFSFDKAILPFQNYLWEGSPS